MVDFGSVVSLRAGESSLGLLLARAGQPSQASQRAVQGVLILTPPPRPTAPPPHHPES